MQRTCPGESERGSLKDQKGTGVMRTEKNAVTIQKESTEHTEYTEAVSRLRGSLRCFFIKYLLSISYILTLPFAACGGWHSVYSVYSVDLYGVLNSYFPSKSTEYSE